MTIKNRLFFSNIRMLLISFAALGVIVRIASYVTFGTWKLNLETIRQFNEFESMDSRRIIWHIGFIFFILLVSIINNILTHRMTRRIIKPLEPLSEGVKQIQSNNLAYRIDYSNEDEFRPVCDAFNEMAEKLEASALRQKKDEANRRELIAGISHDLRTPLTSIKGCIEGFETGVAATPEMREKYLSIIKNKTKSMEHIIEQLFLFSKLDMDEFPLNLRKTDIARAVNDMIEDAAPEYSSRGLEINIMEIPKEIYVNTDVIMLRNVIINILENSVKYKIKEQGKMEISACIENGLIFLIFTDDGPGVSEDVLPKLFDVFYRSDPSRTKHGSGLGLAISAKIIERMGGSICASMPDAGSSWASRIGLSVVIKLPIL